MWGAFYYVLFSPTKSILGVLCANSEGHVWTRNVDGDTFVSWGIAATEHFCFQLIIRKNKSSPSLGTQGRSHCRFSALGMTGLGFLHSRGAWDSDLWNQGTERQGSPLGLSRRGPRLSLAGLKSFNYIPDPSLHSDAGAQGAAFLTRGLAAVMLWKKQRPEKCDLWSELKSNLSLPVPCLPCRFQYMIPLPSQIWPLILF